MRSWKSIGPFTLKIWPSAAMWFEEQRLGQRKDALASVLVHRDNQWWAGNEWMDECEWWSGFISNSCFNRHFNFNRVNLMSTKAWMDRWKEEVTMVQNKTRWMPLWLVYHRKHLGRKSKKEWTRGFERTCLLYLEGRCGCRQECQMRLWMSIVGYDEHQWLWAELNFISNNVHEYLKRRKNAETIYALGGLACRGGTYYPLVNWPLIAGPYICRLAHLECTYDLWLSAGKLGAWVYYPPAGWIAHSRPTYMLAGMFGAHIWLWLSAGPLVVGLHICRLATFGACIYFNGCQLDHS